MKKLRNTVLAFLLFSTGAFFAQTDTVHNKRKATYEAGVNLLAFTLRQGDFYSNYNTTFDNQVLGGLYFKCFKGQNALRFGLDYSQRNLFFTSSGLNRLSRIRSFEIKAGYQRMFGKRKLAAYFYTDLEYNSIRREGVTASNSYILPQFSSYSNYYNVYYNILSHYGCVTPGLGLRWKLGKYMALNFESGAQFFYVKEYNVYSGSGRSKAIGINAKSLKISLGFIF